MHIETIDTASGVSLFQYTTNDHSLTCRRCFGATNLTCLGIRRCEHEDAHLFVGTNGSDASKVHAICLWGQKRSKHAKQIGQLVSAAIDGILDIKNRRVQSLSEASTVAVHNTRNITASINSKLLSLIDETALANADDKVTYVEQQLGYRPREFAREVLSILKAITQANVEYTILDYLTGTRPLTQQDFATHKIHTLCALSFYLYDAEFRQNSIRVHIGKSHQTCCINFTTIKTVLGQLFENSLKYMKPNSDLKISFETNSREVVSIQLVMQSLAFHNSEIPRLLSVGERGKETEGRHYKGVGMGLAMVQSLVALNYGTFELSADDCSRQVIDGIPYTQNTFTVRLLRNQNQLIEKLRHGEQTSEHVRK